ncbi:MAG: DUF3467 domain-containing protein [Patescibacteria group bacterium]|nr:DUF3467 domain-containing protein [Patescibacteria group bacterium]
MADKTPQTVETVINTGTVVGSAYSQIARVTVTDIDLTIEFAYINPSDVTKGQVVARVTLPLGSGIALAQTILQTQNLHEKKKKGKQDD